MASWRTLLLQLLLLLRTTLYLPYRAVMLDWWCILLNFQLGTAIWQPMTVLFLTCNREETHGPQCQGSMIHLPPLFQGQLIKNLHYMKTILIKSDLSNKCQIMQHKEEQNLWLEMSTNSYCSHIWTIKLHVHLHSFIFYFETRVKWGLISPSDYFTALFSKLFSSRKHSLCMLGKWHLINCL